MANLDPFRSPEHRAQFIELYDATMRAWPVPYEERDVSTSFGSTHVVVTGKESAPPLVLFHGAATTAAMWGGVIAPLSDVSPLLLHRHHHRRQQERRDEAGT
jgi:hypothetical protein